MSGFYVPLDRDVMRASRHLTALWEYAGRVGFGKPVYYQGKRLTDYREEELYNRVWDGYDYLSGSSNIQITTPDGELTYEGAALLQSYQQATHVKVWDSEDEVLVKLLKPASAR